MATAGAARAPASTRVPGRGARGAEAARASRGARGGAARGGRATATSTGRRPVEARARGDGDEERAATASTGSLAASGATGEVCRKFPMCGLI